MTTHRRNDTLAVALLVLLPTIFFWDVLAGINGLYLRDLSRFHYPMKQILRDVVQSGEFPYWNRLIGGGQPLAANPQNEVFYPPNWLIFLPSYDFGFRLHLLLHIYIALLGMYALLRSRGCRVESSLFGAISFGLGALVLSLVNLLPIFFCAAWVPLTCLFAWRLADRPNRRDFALASLLFGLQCLIGEPTILLQTFILIFVYAVFRGWRAAALTILVTIAAMLAGAVQLVPARDLMRDSVRAEGLNFDLVAAWSMPPAKVAELLFPNLLGHTSINGIPWYWGARLYPGLHIPFLLNIYCGLGIVVFAVAGLVRRAAGWSYALLILIISIVLALGAYTPLLRGLYNAGIAASLRYPEKFIFMGVFALIVFGAQALDRALDADTKILEIAIAFTIAIGLIAGAIWLSGATRYSVFAFLDAFGLEPSGGAMLLIAQAWSDWLSVAERALALLILLVTIGRARRSIWVFAALVFLCVDLVLIVHELNPRIPNTFFTQRPAMANALEANRTAFRIYHEADWESGTPEAHKFFRSGPQTYWVARNGLFPPINAAYGIASVMQPDYDKTALAPTTEFGRVVRDVSRSGRPNWWQPLMRMSNAWYRAVYNDFAEESRNSGGDFTKLVPVTFIAEKEQPRYYFADEVVSVSGSRDFTQRLIANDFSDNVAMINAAAFTPARGVVERVRETANRAIIDVTATGRSFLVMSVTAHKYWQVAIDGARVTPLSTNIAYQGIIVPAGKHRITMTYRNPLILFGGIVSILAIATLIAMASVGRRA